MYLSYQSRSFLALVIFCYGKIFGQLQKTVLNDSLFSTYYHQRVSHFKSLPLKPRQIVFSGNSITDGASIIPLPRKIEWGKSSFPISECTFLVVRDSVLLKEANYLRQKFNEKGIILKISNKLPDRSDSPYIELKLGPVEVPQFTEEAYRLQVNDHKVLLTANTAHGIFNGIQTFLQLDGDSGLIDNCEIVDWPAFAWRGYMVDAARNYQSMDLLKQQIDVMSRYKLNIFHFHLTEDIAWRLSIKQYPQLVAADNMLRNKGRYYTEADLKELIAYCKERYITLIPEIDMPGHSAAFTRAFNTGMQTDSGVNIVKKILKEVLQTYDIPYLHIGADEVKITNKRFVPDITNFIESFGRKVIGWEPGGNFNEGTIRQLWMDDGGKLSDSHSIRYLDSRHLYLNHMDPLESVVTIFNRKIAGKEQGDSQALGAILCVWPDRRVEREDDALRMNAVYPGMISFAERCWRGGGPDGLTATIGDAKSKEALSFLEFENRLLDHKKLFFQALPFPYVKQSSTIWKLNGPYNNYGNPDASFAPEQKGFDENKQKTFEAVGGTIILRHWWYPKIKGVVNDPKENTTWYAIGGIWSEEDKIQNFWIGFNNLSRSYNTDSPVNGTWNNLGSKIWINGETINPPLWKHSGQKGHSEMPLIDEGYEYRTPTAVPLKKGWNSILIKLPVGRFTGKDWQNPIKWMFTCVPVYD